MAKLRAWVRIFVTQSVVRWNPLHLIVAPRVRAAFAISEHVRGLLPAGLRARTVIHTSIGLDPTWIGNERPTKPKSETILYVGRAMDIKLPRLALQVVNAVIAARPGVDAIMIGEGLSAMLAAEPRAQGVQLREHIAQASLRELYASSALFLFPSVEAAGFVTLEALASGLPVACLKGTGADLFAGSDNPLSVAMDGDWSQVQGRLVDAILAYLEAGATHATVEAASKTRAKGFMWDSYRQFIEAEYAETQTDRSLAATADHH